MKKKHVIISLFVILLLTMACAIGYEGLQISDDPETVNILDLTATTEDAQPSTADQPVSIPEPTSQPVLPAEPEAQTEPETETAGPKEYSVAATNFNCTCQENGNVTIEFNIKGDQLEYPNGVGGVDLYEKIGENTYKRSWMGYYILSSGEGEDATETKVDEERSVVIILNDSGYVMEHYQGTSNSPCCFYTFTNTK